jgi:hypothetical protein
MQWNEITRRIERLSRELKELLTEDYPGGRSLSDLDGEADDWVRQYVRSRVVEAPSKEVGLVLLARAEYAASFLKLAPEQKIPVSTPKAAIIVEAVMIDLWYQFAGRSGWVEAEQVAFAA